MASRVGGGTDATVVDGRIAAASTTLLAQSRSGEHGRVPSLTVRRLRWYLGWYHTEPHQAREDRQNHL
jgi:hypothetical protein